MKPLIAVLYISFGLIIVTLTYFENFSGPKYITDIGWFLVIFGLFYPYYSIIVNYFKLEFKEEKKDI